MLVRRASQGCLTGCDSSPMSSRRWWVAASLMRGMAWGSTGSSSSWASAIPRLVVRRSCPQPAAHVLIERPPVHQEVEGVVRRTHLKCVERRIPRSAHSFQRGLRGSNITVPAHQLARMVHILPLAEEKHEAVALTGELIERSLELTDIMKPSRHLIQP